MRPACRSPRVIICRRVGPITVVATCLKGGRAKVRLQGVPSLNSPHADHYYEYRTADEALLIPMDYVQAVRRADLSLKDLSRAIERAAAAAEGRRGTRRRR